MICRNENPKRHVMFPLFFFFPSNQKKRNAHLISPPPFLPPGPFLPLLSRSSPFHLLPRPTLFSFPFSYFFLTVSCLLSRETFVLFYFPDHALLFLDIFCCCSLFSCIWLPRVRILSVYVCLLWLCPRGLSFTVLIDDAFAIGQSIEPFANPV